MSMKSMFKTIVAGLALTAVGISTAFAGTLEDVKRNGSLQCGVTTGLLGFSKPDANGKWSGLDVDFCRAVAAAIFGDANKVNFVPLSAKERFTALQQGDVDLLSRTTTWSMSRDTSLGLTFAGVMYYDGQGFMVPKAKNITSLKQLDGKTICVRAGTTTELNLIDYLKSNKLQYKLVDLESADEVRTAYDEGKCDAFTTDQSGLYGERLALKTPEDHVILPDLISNEPLGPAVRQGDVAWFNLVKWTYFALVNAEDLGVSQSNLDQMMTSEDPKIRRLLGLPSAEGEPAGFGTGMGIDEAWAVHIIKAVGNYGDIFERNVGPATPLKIERGVNALWRNGGLQYAPPIR
jgi:general L-amino acid transport system substrate-binding protein